MYFRVFGQTNSSHNLALVNLYLDFQVITMATKRKYVVLTIETKYKIIKEPENGESATKLTIHGVSTSIITDIIKQKYDIENYMHI